MPDDTLKNMVIASITITLFAFLLISFSVTMANHYGRSTTTYDQNSLNFTALNSSINNVEETAANWRTIFEKQNIFNPLVVSGIVVTTFFKLTVGMFSFVTDVFNLVFIQIFNNVLHIPPAVTGIIFVIVTISGIFGIWYAIKGS